MISNLFEGEILQPCALFDRQHPSCPVAEMDLGEGPDAVFIFGAPAAKEIEIRYNSKRNNRTM